MKNFIYVTKKEAAPYKNELIEFLKVIQNEVRDAFTFRFDFVGSSSRNMITCEKNGNKGFDFDVNIEPNDPDEKYSAELIHRIIYEAMLKHKMMILGYSMYSRIYPSHHDPIYFKMEDSTSVITIKNVDRKNSRITHSYDFAIVHHYNDKGRIRQEYIKFDKKYNKHIWEVRGKGFCIDKKIEWLKRNRHWEELRDYYLIKKNENENPYKHSCSLFAESVNDLYNKYSRK